MKKPYKWLLRVEPGARHDITKIATRRDRLAVFEAMRRLLEADNPYGVAGVQKLADSRLGGIRRYRQGDYRILFVIEVGEVVHLAHRYSGTLLLIGVLRRDEDTYR